MCQNYNNCETVFIPTLENFFETSIDTMTYKSDPARNGLKTKI